MTRKSVVKLLEEKFGGKWSYNIRLKLWKNGAGTEVKAESVNRFLICEPGKASYSIELGYRGE